MSTIDTICAAYEGLSPTERRVADFIIKNVADVARLSVHEIARGCGTSGATVSRFVRHVGFESFSEMRLSIASMGLDHDTSPCPATEISFDDVGGSIEYILGHKLQEIRNTASALDPERLRRVVDMVNSSDSILFAAVGNSIPVCSNLAFKLGQVGVRCSCPATTESMVLASMALRPTDLLVVVSSSGCSRRLETIVDNAEDSGTPIVMVTSNPSSALAERADVVLVAANRDQLLTGSQFSTHLSAVFLVETVFMFVLVSAEHAQLHADMERKSLGRDKEATPTLS